MQHADHLGHGGGGEIRQFGGLLLIPAGRDPVGRGGPPEFCESRRVDTDQNSLDHSWFDGRETHSGRGLLGLSAIDCRNGQISAGIHHGQDVGKSLGEIVPCLLGGPVQIKIFNISHAAHLREST